MIRSMHRLDLPPPQDLAALRRALLAWHRRNGLRAPWRASGDPYHVLVAAVMAQQTQISRVLPKFDEFVAAFPTVEALAQAPTAEVLRLWAPLGYNLRALRLQRAAQLVIDAGGFPRTVAELKLIEGVGPFTAAIVASFAFGEPAAAVDTNVRRVVSRLVAGDGDALSGRALQQAADALVSRRAAGRWNQAMMDLGARVCTARAPRCDVCPLARWCRARPRLAAGSASRRVADQRGSYRAQPSFIGSRRYYRGRIVQALRELPPGASITAAELLERLPHRDGLDEATLRELAESLRHDGLLHMTARGRLRLP